MNGHNQM